MALLETHQLRKTYARGKLAVEVLRGIDVTIERGEFVSIVGPSGSGKTTFMQLCGGLDRPSAGSARIDGQALDAWSDGKLSAFRRQKLGFIFQFFNLIPTQTAQENVALPLLLDGQAYAKVAPRARELLERMGLGSRLGHRPAELSGGEMQRVAIARALIGNPVLILADEPTGNLDSKSGAIVLEVFRDIVKERGHTVIMVTHDPKAAASGDRIIAMRDGQIESDQASPRLQVAC
jgi:putative ABC transport system ATP-binding protein